jgi:hypothetical protein
MSSCPTGGTWTTGSTVRQELVQERSATAVLRRIAAELALELDRARTETGGNVTRLQPRKAEHT